MFKSLTIILLFNLFPYTQRIIFPNTNSGLMNQADIKTVNEIMNYIIPNYLLENNLEFVKGTILKDISLKKGDNTYTRNYSFSMKNKKTVCRFDLGVCGEDFIYGPENEKFKKEMEHCNALIKRNNEDNNNFHVKENNENPRVVRKQKDFVIGKKRKIVRPVVIKNDIKEPVIQKSKSKTLIKNNSSEEDLNLAGKSLSFEITKKRNNSESIEIPKLKLEKSDSSEEIENTKEVTLSFEKPKRNANSLENSTKKLTIKKSSSSEENQNPIDMKTINDYNKAKWDSNNKVMDFINNVNKKGSLSFEKPKRNTKSLPENETEKLDIKKKSKSLSLSTSSISSEEKISESDMKKELDVILGGKGECDDRNRKEIKSLIRKLQLRNKFQYVILYDENILECKVKLVQGIVYEIVLSFNDEKCDLSIWATLDDNLKILDGSIKRENSGLARGGVKKKLDCLERFGTDYLNHDLNDLRK